MIIAYVQAALSKAKYEIIDDPEPYYGEIPGLRGVWATGNTLEECRQNLIDSLDSWIVARLQHGLKVPSVGGIAIRPMREIANRG
jgi:predicted RNase H-like HicB family nuclease